MQPSDVIRPALPVLYINLDRAPQRRKNIEAGIAAHLPGCAAVRIPGVDGSALTPSQIEDALTPSARLTLRHPERTVSHAQIETIGAVGCTLSHVRCWDWILAQPEGEGPGATAALILEDDACFGPHFRSEWDRRISRLLDAPGPRAWDVLMLGFDALTNATPAAVGGQPLRTLAPGGSLFGTHAYIVSREGAARLRRHAVPMEMQTDAYLVCLQQLGVLRLFVLPSHPTVTQCLGATERGIAHGYRPSAEDSIRTATAYLLGYSHAPSSVPWATALLAMFLVTALSVATAVCCVARRPATDRRS